MTTSVIINVCSYGNKNWNATEHFLHRGICLIKCSIWVLLPIVLLPVDNPSLFSHEKVVKYPVIHAERRNPWLFFVFPNAKSQRCQAIVVWLSKGAWDLVTGTFYACVNSYLRAVSTGCKPYDDARRWSLNDNMQKSDAQHCYLLGLLQFLEHN